MSLIDEAIARSERRAALTRPIDYDRIKREMPKLKAALTRAVKTGDPEKVAAECVRAMTVWDEVGAWPDHWNEWQIALDSVLPWHRRVDLRDLPRKAPQ